MTKVVLDTSIVIDFTRAGVGQLFDLIETAKAGEIELLIPTAVILELWAGKTMKFSKNQKEAEKLFSGIKRIDLTEVIAKLAGELLRQNSIIQSMDAVIAASALESGAYLATGNQRHFSRVKNLKLFDSGKTKI